MKRRLLAVTLLAIAAFAVGCKPSAEQERKTAAEEFDKVQKETRAAAQEMKDYTFAQKADFIERMQAQMAEINRDLDQLALRVEKSSAEAKAEAKLKIQALRDQTAKLTQQLDETRNATASTWDDVKAAFKKGYGEAKDGVQSARQWVSDKIAP